MILTAGWEGGVEVNPSISAGYCVVERLRQFPR